MCETDARGAAGHQVQRSVQHMCVCEAVNGEKLTFIM